MTRLDIGPSPAPAQDRRERRLNWSALSVIVALIVALIGWLLAGLGDYQSVGRRVTTLEVQRIEDVKTREQQRSEDRQRMERIEDKLDRIWERIK